MSQKKTINSSEKLFALNKEAFGYKLSQSFLPAAQEAVGKRNVGIEDIVWEHPARADHGDFAASIALRLLQEQSEKKTGKLFDKTQGKRKSKGKTGSRSSVELAQAMVNIWRSQGLPEFVGKVEVVLPGFINVWLKTEFLSRELAGVLEKKEAYGRLDLLKGKKILLEHTSPNPQTTIMLGHLRNNFLGMAISRLWEYQGAEVVKDCIVNDRGVHLCRAMWGYLIFGRKRSGFAKKELLDFRRISRKRFEEVLTAYVRSARASSSGQGTESWRVFLQEWSSKKSLWWQPRELGLKADHTNLIWYVLGSRAYKTSEEIQNQVRQILVAWEKEDRAVRAFWRQIIDWSKKGYAETYERVGSRHDKYWYESNHWKQGKEWVVKGLGRGVFQESEGAIVTDLAKYGLPDTVVQKADGTALYLTQDLALTKLKVTTYPSDLYVWDIGNEQKLYLEQMYAVCDQLGIVPREKLFHLNYALINFRGSGKMATRTGDVVTADGVLDELRGKALKIIKGSNQELRGKLTKKQLDGLAETVALGAIKYSLLKYSRETTIQFDVDESLALEGNSGPYLQYTYARTQSVLAKGKSRKGTGGQKNNKDLAFLPISPLASEEISVLRLLYQFPEVVEEAARSYAPNLICSFLYDLAQKYNLFYNKLSILKAATPERVRFRLALTAGVAQILKNGLNLLGMATPERM